jgi:hypothetical protein
MPAVSTVSPSKYVGLNYANEKRDKSNFFGTQIGFTLFCAKITFIFRVE